MLKTLLYFAGYGGVLVKSRSHLWLLGKRLIYSGLKMVSHLLSPLRI